MIRYERYPDGLVYLATGVLLGVALALAFGRCSRDDGDRAAVRPTPESAGAETAVGGLHEVKRKDAA